MIPLGSCLPSVAKESFAEVEARLAPHFGRREARAHGIAYLHGLLSPIQRKNAWQLAEAAGDSTPDGMQYFLKRSTWDPDVVRDDLHAYVNEHFGNPDGVLIVDETGFLKKGDKSAGVQRQYSGTAGRIENCQIGVFLGYAAPSTRVLIDRMLYVPQQWCSDQARCEEAGIPPHIGFRTKPRLGCELLKRAQEHHIPARWVTADEVYGSDYRFRKAIEECGWGYVVAVRCTQPIGFSRADVTIQRLPTHAWQRMSAGYGSKGPRWYDWAFVPLWTSLREGWEHGLLARRSISKPNEIAYYLTSAPTGTPLETLVRVAGMRWNIESCFEATKNDVGLDQYEVRSWIGWYRHITLSMFAHAYLTVVQQRMSGKKRRRSRPSSGAAPAHCTGGPVLLAAATVGSVP